MFMVLHYFGGTGAETPLTWIIVLSEYDNVVESPGYIGHKESFVHARM